MSTHKEPEPSTPTESEADEKELHQAYAERDSLRAQLAAIEKAKAALAATKARLEGGK